MDFFELNIGLVPGFFNEDSMSLRPTKKGLIPLELSPIHQIGLLLFSNELSDEFQ